MLFLILFLLIATIITQAHRKLRRYPLAKGLWPLAVFSLMPWMLSGPVLRIANTFLRLLPIPRGTEDVERKKGSFTASDGKKVRYVAYVPKGASSGFMLYLHGGGFCFEASSYIYRKCRTYAQRALCPVIMIGYRTAERGACPRSYLDAKEGLMHFLENSKGACKVVVGGDSAGGCLAALLCQDPDLRGRISYQLLVYPVIDRSMSSPSARTFIDSPIWRPSLSRRMWTYYLRDGEGGPVDPASCKDLHGLPPAYIEVAEFDSLRDEGIAYAKRLEEAGVDVELSVVKGACHGYDFMAHSPVAMESMKRRCVALSKVFKR